MPREFKSVQDFTKLFKEVAKEALEEWLSSRTAKIIEEVKERARSEDYGGKFSTSIKYKVEPTETGAEGVIESTHPRAKFIIGTLESGRKKFTAKKAFFIEKPGFKPGEVTESGIKVVSFKGMTGIWVRKAGIAPGESLFSDIAKLPPSLYKEYKKTWERYLGGA